MLHRTRGQPLRDPPVEPRAIDIRTSYASTLTMTQPLRLLPLGLTAAAILLGSSRPRNVVGADSPAARPAQAVSAEDAQQWATAFQQAVRTQDVDTVNQLLDWDALIAKTTALENASPKVKQLREAFSRGVKQASISPETGFAHMMSASLEGFGDYRPLHMHRTGDQQRALFRLIVANGTVNYHDFILSRSPSGKVVATDFYVFAIGEYYSQFLRRGFLPLLHQSGGDSTAALAGPEKDFVAHAAQIGQMGVDVQKKNWQKVLDAYKRLPPSVQASKFVLPMRLLAAQSLDMKEYLATIDDLQKYFPNDPMVNMILIDGYTLREQYGKALEACDQLDKAVGGDPYLKSLRAGVLVKQNKLDAARDMAKKAVVEEPTLLRGYLGLIEISLNRHDFVDTLVWIKKAEGLGIQFGNIPNAPAYADFVKSPQGKEWLKSHGL